MKINWDGDALAAKVEKATKLAIDQTMAQAVNGAKRNHKFENRTGVLEGSLQMRPAEPTADGQITGSWGSFDVNYAAPVEDWDAFLRPQADVEYPKLAARIRANLDADD